MEVTKWYVGDIAIDPKGTRWKVIAVNDSNLLPYPELSVELIGPSILPAFRDVMSSRRLKKELAHSNEGERAEEDGILMSDCKFGSAQCTPLHRCEEERVEFDRVLLAATTENLPIPLLLRFKHCVQIVPWTVREKYALPQPTEYQVLVTRLLAEKGTQ